jgi:hypothetical protein
MATPTIKYNSTTQFVRDDIELVKMLLAGFKDEANRTMTIEQRYQGAGERYVSAATAELGELGIGDTKHQGYIKCKLAHGRGISVIIPDFLFIGKDASHWLQPLSFGPPFLDKHPDDQIRCRFSVDVEGGHRIGVTFWQKDLLQQFGDGSELYSCILEGPTDLTKSFTGMAVYSPPSRPLVRLFHHTTQDRKESILKSGEFWLSHWNIQGTETKVVNVGYVYFTSLEKILTTQDLNLIAMASDGILPIGVDNFTPPAMLPPDWQTRFAGQILGLKVYRESTSGRTDSLEFIIDVTSLAPQHLWRHAPANDHVWYEVCNPFVQRIGLVPGNKLPIKGHQIVADGLPLKRFEYVVMGDARKLSGLAAPYNEEETNNILKIETSIDEAGMLAFWFSHGNSDLFTNKKIEFMGFEAK